MYNTILVPLDGSGRGERILPHVEELAQRYEASVIFLRVVEPTTMAVGLEASAMALQEQVTQQLREQAEEYLAGWEGQFREKGINARMLVLHGPVVQSILDTAGDKDVDLIAMASHGRSGLSRVFYGSVAAGVLHRVDRPLLLVRSRNVE